MKMCCREELQIVQPHLIEFNRCRSRYPLSRLLLRDRPTINRCDDGHCQYSLAFVAYYYSHIENLSLILDRFRIETHGTIDFKNRIYESWLDTADNHDRDKQITHVRAALGEVLVADYLANTEQMRDLNAINSRCRSDIVSEKDEQLISTEVKFLGTMPEIRELINQATISGGVAVNWMGSSPALVFNYICHRIATAALQLEDLGIDVLNRRIILLIDHFTQGYVQNSSVLDMLALRRDWCEDSRWPLILARLNTTQRHQIESAIALNEYLMKVGNINIMFLSDRWQLSLAIDHVGNIR